MSAGRGVFVTGTGTEVGKSVVAAVDRADRRRGRGRASRSSSRRSRGSTRAARPTTSCSRRASRDRRSRDDEIAPYRYGPPVSPHLAAELAGEAIDPGVLRDGRRGRRRRPATCSSARGSAGCSSRSPPTTWFATSPRELGYPLVVVASPGLGTINHTLLTIEAARAAGLEVRAVVLTPWPRAPGELERSNRDTIAALGEVEVLTLAEIDLSATRTAGRDLPLA